MVKQTAKIEKYDGNNVYFVGKDKPLFIPPEDIKVAMTNFPSGKVVTYKTKDKQKGTLDGMADPTEREMQSYLQDRKAAGNPDQAFQPASSLPRNDNANIVGGAGCTPHQEPACTPSPAPAGKPTCFKAALCPKGCDGTKDPCQFKPKKAAPAEPPKQPPGSPAPTTPPKGTETPKKTTPAPAQGQSINEDAIREMLEDFANMDPRLLDYLKEKEPDLVKAFVDKMEPLLHEVKERQKGPMETGQFPTPDELLAMVYNYDTYWRSKTILDLMARQDIRQQVEFKNWHDCLDLAISFHKMDHPSHAELQKLFTTAVFFKRFINDRLNNIPLLDEVE